MDTLRRVLYAHSGLSAVAGFALATVPGFVVHTVLRNPALAAEELTWPRLVGVQLIAAAMVMTLVGHRVQGLWWWAWAFAFADVMTAVAVVLNTAFGLSAGQSPLAWWLFSAAAVGLALATLYALYVCARENPLP